MKKMLVACLLITVFLIDCKSSPVIEKESLTSPNVAAAGTSDFSNIAGKNWKLTEVRINNVDIGFNRSSLNTGVNADFFTASFDAEMISGTGAPNRYSAPYKLGAGRDISFAMVRATLMASIFEHEKLKEHNFFNYIQNTYGWNVINNNLVLSSKVDKDEITLVFSL